MADQNSKPVTGSQVYPCVSPEPNAPQNQPTNNCDCDPRWCFGAVYISLFGFLCFMIWQIWLDSIGYPRFHIHTFTVSNFSFPTSYEISGVWDAKFIVRNPESLSFYCDEIKVAVLYHSCSISATTMPSFMQGTKNDTTIHAKFSYSRVNCYDRDGLRQEMEKFSVWMMVRVQPIAWASAPARKKLRVFCDDLQIAFSSEGDRGTLLGGPKKCWVDDSRV